MENKTANVKELNEKSKTDNHKKCVLNLPISVIFVIIIKFAMNIKVKHEKDKNYYHVSFQDKKMFNEVIKTEINKKILECRFGYGMSIRDIHKLIEGYYSIGYIQTLCKKSAIEAEKKMSVLNHCTMNKAKTMIFDETFLKTIENGTVRLGVVADEFGLIRAIEIIPGKMKHKKLVRLFKSCITEHYTPLYFISDYDNSYPKAIREVLSNIEIYKDFVHATRQVFANINSTINKMQVKINKSCKITKTKQKEIVALKKRLLRKQINKIMKYLYKGFSCNKVSVGTIYLEGFLHELEALANKYSSILPLYDKTKKFFKKYLETWNQQMKSYAADSIPLTSNIIESKNSIFKSFSKKSKSFKQKNLKSYYCAIALYENFDIKTRGKNADTSAVIRAGVDFEKFGAQDFFEAVGIKSISKITSRNLLSITDENMQGVA